MPFFSISGSEFVEMFVGVGASRVRDLFKKVCAPPLLSLSCGTLPASLAGWQAGMAGPALIVSSGGKRRGALRSSQHEACGVH